MNARNKVTAALRRLLALTIVIASLLGRWFWWPQIVRTRASRRRLQSIEAEPTTATIATGV